MCRGPVRDTYYHVSGVVCCGTCSERRLAGQQQQGGAGEFSRGILYGGAAAVAGAIVWAIVIYVIHAQFAILSILIGVMVGKAITYGSGGCRGRKYQIAAVLLTYASIVTSYMIMLVSEIRDPAALPLSTWAKLIAYDVVGPFLGILGGVSGILTLLIIFFGLQRAWRYTAPDKAPILGPYPTSDLSASNT
jgi:hypothetical protein